VNEFSDKTRKVGQEYITNLKPTLIKIEEETQMVLDGATRRVGESTESTLVDEYWEYYSQFSSTNLPDPKKYMGGEFAEMKIIVLLRLFQEHYLNRVYPRSFPTPIIQHSFRSSKNNPKKPTKFYFVGDTHGSFIDTVKLIKNFVYKFRETEKDGNDVRTVWIGDFVDRNLLDIHNILYIMTFNLKFPDRVLLLRGNHEEISISGNYGFGKNVIDNFSKMLFASFNHVFKDLPLISIYHCNNGSVMCLHGGIPLIKKGDSEFEVPQLVTHEFNNRQVLIDDMDPITQQILWNDPILNYVSGVNEKFYENRRGLGYVFGKEVFEEFLAKNNVNIVYRGHQVFLEGFHQDFDKKFVTIFSASDYAGKKITARYAEFDSEDIYAYKIHIIQELPDL
jgi:hypothetical protein